MIRSICVLLLPWALMSLVACGDDPAVALTCDNILPADQARFSTLAQKLKPSCGGCHAGSTPHYGYDFSSDGAAYDSAAYKARTVYFQLALGLMPDGAESESSCDDSTVTESDRWCEDELKLFRSWYCHGALYD